MNWWYKCIVYLLMSLYLFFRMEIHKSKNREQFLIGLVMSIFWPISVICAVAMAIYMMKGKFNERARKASK